TSAGRSHRTGRLDTDSAASNPELHVAADPCARMVSHQSSNGSSAGDRVLAALCLTATGPMVPGSSRATTHWAASSGPARTTAASRASSSGRSPVADVDVGPVQPPAGRPQASTTEGSTKAATNVATAPGSNTSPGRTRTAISVVTWDHSVDSRTVGSSGQGSKAWPAAWASEPGAKTTVAVGP